jgi:hypothetical protein
MWLICPLELAAGPIAGLGISEGGASAGVGPVVVAEALAGASIGRGLEIPVIEFIGSGGWVTLGGVSAGSTESIPLWSVEEWGGGDVGEFRMRLEPSGDTSRTK